MCNPACIEFVRSNLTHQDVQGRSVIEVGSRNVNGSARSVIEALGPGSYIGVDIEPGPGVDLICDAAMLVRHFGPEAFEVLISTELLEHVQDWRSVIRTFKQVLRPGGIIVITTRSKGFPYHGHPYDFWRYELSDVQFIFSDFLIEALESDPTMPGVFLKARKPHPFIENDTTPCQLYSIRSHEGGAEGAEM